MSTVDKIKEIEDEISRTQKNKATEFHIGRLKAKLAQLRRELITGTKAGKGGGPITGFEVQKTGLQVSTIGFPSVGKSTLLNKLTGAHSEVAAYEFTTLTAIPGTMDMGPGRCPIQVVDLPGIIEGAKDGKGRGRQVIATARTADLLLIVLDATKSLVMKKKVEKELEGFGIRLNKRPPAIDFRRREKGGISFTTVVDCEIDEALITSVLAEYKIFNADIVCREPGATIDDIIDIVEGNRVYMPALYVLNKIDSITIEELDLLDELPNWIPISAEHEWNLDELKDRIWDKLQITRIYTKPKGENVDFDEPVIIRNRKELPTVENFCAKIHRDLIKKMKYAVVWGSSVPFSPMHVGKNHIMNDEDVCQIVTNI